MLTCWHNEVVFETKLWSDGCYWRLVCVFVEPLRLKWERAESACGSPWISQDSVPFELLSDPDFLEWIEKNST